MTVKLYVFGFLLFFYLIVFVFRSYLLWRQTGINPMTFEASDDAHSFNGKLLKFIAFLEIVVVLVYSFGGDWYDYLLPFWYLEKPSLQILGWIFLHGSLVWIFAAQLQMAQSWRIGIDYQRKTKLVTHGLFSISRNPIFLGILLADLGLFLVIPNAFTLLIAIWSYSVIQTQVRLEEAHLKSIHGKEYEKFLTGVRRWL